MYIHKFIVSMLSVLHKKKDSPFNNPLPINLSFIFLGLFFSVGTQALPGNSLSYQDADDVSGVVVKNSSVLERDAHRTDFISNRNSIAHKVINVLPDSNESVNNGVLAGSANAVQCDDNAFVTSGSDLINQIRIQSFDCVGHLFGDASDAVRIGTFTKANIITVAREAKNKSRSYNGTDSDLNLRSLYYWIRAFYFYGNRQLLTPKNQLAVKGAIDALVANSHFYDKTEENARVLALAIGGSINNASIGERYIPLLNSLLDIYDKSYDDVPQWGNVFADIVWNTLNQCARLEPCRASTHNTTLVSKIGGFIQSNIDWLDKPSADYHLHNLGYQLANFYSGSNESHFESLRPELETQLHKIFNDFGPNSADIARRAYLQALAVVTSRNQCEIYNVCTKKQEIIASVLNDRINCPSGTLFMWAQDMNQAQLEWACNSLGGHERYFHDTLQTNNIPVTPDDNDILRMIVFNDSREWSIYGFVLFGASTNNGGLYLEGDPSKAGDQATFFAYEHVAERPVFDIWNLRHEYIHYLDGRFNTKGDFRETNGAGRTVWYQEGIAEYISLKDCNDSAIAQAAEGTYSLSTIFQNEYGVGQNRIYRWGYLANRFMFEQHNADFFSMLDLFRQGEYPVYRGTLVDNWINNQTFDTEFAAWLPTIESAGCETDDSRPPSPVEPINVDDIQDKDQVGIDACAIGDPVSLDFGKIQAGKAICLSDVSNANQMQMAISVPSGLVDVTLQITLRHGDGNANLLHRFEHRPTDATFDNISNSSGTEQTILVNPVQQNWNYIHVRADTDFSGVTLLARYIQNGVAMSDAPIALTPKTVIVDNTPTFTWTEVPGTVRYAVVAQDSNGAYLVNNSTGSIKCPDGICSYTKNNTVFADGTYSWNVRVINPDNSNGASSSTLNFTVDTGNNSPDQIIDACQQGYTPVENVELIAGNAVCLQDVSNGAQGGQRQMHFFVPSDKVGSTLEIILSHGSGDGILLHRHDDRPTQTHFDHISNSSGNEERVLVHNVQQQWNYIHVQTDSAFSGATLLVRYIQ